MSRMKRKFHVRFLEEGERATALSYSAMYLYKIYPDSSYPSNISRHTKIDPTNVIGGLRGMGSRYNKTNSLIGIKLVEEVQLNGATYYKLTETGKKLIESMKLI
jgi:predicted transcriptional regulator with HTH domain